MAEASTNKHENVVSLISKYPSGVSGIMEKRGHFRTNWKGRYCTLIPEDKVIRYFTDPGQTHIKGEIYLDHESSVEPYSQNVMENHNHVFVVNGKSNSKKTVYYFSTSNDKTRQKWIDAINETIRDGFPLIRLPKVWDHPFHCTSHVACIADRLDGQISASPLTLPELRKPPLITFTRPVRTVRGRDPYDAFYTLVMFDPDMPPSGYLSWLVMNVVDREIFTGTDIVTYSSPAPLYGKRHQVLFLLFEQDGKYSESELAEYRTAFSNRFEFKVEEMTKTCRFLTVVNPFGPQNHPIGVSNLLLDWEPLCDELHAIMSYKPMKSDMSPYQRLELLKYCYHHYKLSSWFYYIDDYSLMNNWVPIALSYRLNRRRTKSGDPEIRHSHVGDNTVSNVFNGDVVLSKVVHNEPEIKFSFSSDESSSDSLYTLVLTNLDPPEQSDEQFCVGCVEWMLCNITAAGLSSGEQVYPYLPNTDLNDKATPYQRHVLALFKQGNRIQINDIVSLSNQNRHSFKLFPVLESLKIEVCPIGLTMFVTTSLESDEHLATQTPIPSSTWHTPRKLCFNHPGLSANPKGRKSTKQDYVDDIIEDDDESQSVYSAKESVSPHPFERLKELVEDTYAEEIKRLFESGDISEIEKKYQMQFVTGEVVRKKFSKDYVSKNRFVWIDPGRQTLNWALSEKDKLSKERAKYVSIAPGNVVQVDVFGKTAVIQFTAGSSISIEVLGDNPYTRIQCLANLINKIHSHHRKKVVSPSP